MYRTLPVLQSEDDAIMKCFAYCAFVRDRNGVGFDVYMFIYFFQVGQFW